MMNSSIFVLESASEMKAIPTQNGTMQVQTVKLRELTGGSAYTQRWIVDNLSGIDISDMTGKPIACCIENIVTGKDGREWNNLRIREVAPLCPPSRGKGLTNEPF